jgi:hypothetical protein
MKYPLEPKKDWHTDADYKKTDGKLVKMSPEKFLKQVRPMDFDKRDINNIGHQIKQIDQGKNKMEPLSLRADGTEDGRHRAVTAMIKGIKKVPVLKWPGRETPDEADGKGVMKQIKKVVKKFREKEKH